MCNSRANEFPCTRRDSARLGATRTIDRLTDARALYVIHPAPLVCTNEPLYKHAQLAWRLIDNFHERSIGQRGRSSCARVNNNRLYITFSRVCIHMHVHILALFPPVQFHSRGDKSRRRESRCSAVAQCSRRGEEERREMKLRDWEKGRS